MYMFFWFFKQLYYCLRRIFKSGILLLIVFFIAFLFIFVKPTFAATPNATYDVEQELVNLQKDYQNEFALNCLTHYYSNLRNGDEVWTDILEPVLRSYFRADCSIYILPSHSTNNTSSTFTIYIHNGVRTNLTTANYTSVFNNVSYPIDYATYSNVTKIVYTDNLTNPTLSTKTTTNLPTFQNYRCLNSVKSDLFLDLIHIVNAEVTDYSVLLNDIKTYLSSINTNTDTITNYTSTLLTVLQNISSIITSISQQPNHDYSNSLSDISSEITDILSSNQTIISQNTDMLEQQEQINNNLETLNNTQQQTTQAVENLENTITDTNIDNSSINLPTDNSTDITQEGLNGIFTSIYNAFCIGEPQDIVFPIPFTNKNITLQPNYVRSMLTSSGANWVITIIEAFWWYLISRFIIKDITNKITKIKSGNIENIENSNIKGDML